MPPLSRDELDRAYRTLLRAHAQERARADAYRAELLTLKGRCFGITQSIDEAIVRLEREHRRQSIGRELDALAPSPLTNLGDSVR